MLCQKIDNIESIFETSPLEPDSDFAHWLVIGDFKHLCNKQYLKIHIERLIQR